MAGATAVGCLWLAGCTEMAQRTPAASPAHSGGVQPTLDRGSFHVRLFDVAEYASSEVGNAAVRILDEGPDAALRLEAQSLRGRVATITTAIVTRDQPEAALLDLLIYLKLERWVCERRLARSPQAQAIVKEAFERSILHGDRLAALTLSREQRDRLDELVESWKSEHPDAAAIGMVRLEDLSTLRERPYRPEVDRIAPSLLSPITEAEREMERTRQFGERLSFALRRFPFLLRWQTEEAMFRLLAQPEVARFESALNDGRASIERLGSAIEQARNTAEEIEKAVTSLEPGDLAPARELASEVRLAIADTKAMLPDAQRMVVELKEAMAGAERVTTALHELTRGPDGKPVDFVALGNASERFATAATDLRAAVQQANALLASDDATQRLAELTDTGTKGIDHIIWRVALLMVIAAALSMVLMVVRSLTRPRSEQASRGSRGERA
ncbi:MAG: hypothetical protein JNL80_08305 [Phycisphaerae bacterium]|nr:hypothetical protein [Phycisphaerae bacterium]